MSHHQAGENFTVSWACFSMASLFGFLQSYAMGVLSVGCMLAGLVIQYKTYRLRVREVESKLGPAKP